MSGILLETGGEEDNLIIMDQPTFATVTGGPGRLNLIEVTADSPEAVPLLTTQLRQELPDATISSVRQSLEFTSRANGALTGFGLAIAALIVFIAGLVVMITMLSAVKERQKEIGVFRAVGFGQRDVAALVLYETAVLSGAAAYRGRGGGADRRAGTAADHVHALAPVRLRSLGGGGGRRARLRPRHGGGAVSCSSGGEPRPGDGAEACLSSKEEGRA